MSSELATSKTVTIRAEGLTTEDLRALRAKAALEGKTVQQLVGELLRAGVAA